MQEEMKRGYFDDFKDLKETQGRMFEPSEALSVASSSPQLPTIAVRPAPHLLYWGTCLSCTWVVSSAYTYPNCQYWKLIICGVGAMGHGPPLEDDACCVQAAQADGTEIGFPPAQGSFQAALLCVAFRAGAEVKGKPPTPDHSGPKADTVQAQHAVL